MIEETAPRFAEKKLNSATVATRMANLLSESLNLIEQKVSAGDTGVALNYIEAFHMCQAMNPETFELSPSELLLSHQNQFQISENYQGKYPNKADEFFSSDCLQDLEVALSELPLTVSE